jgi:hypothetical protein
MEKFYSRVEPKLLLHIVYRLEEFKVGREEIIAPDQFIQCAALWMGKGKTFKPHKHNIREVTDIDRIAQESWVVIKGEVIVTMYDTDDAILDRVVLHAGDASFTLRGGHNYLVTEDDTIVYEYKTGKYEGQLKDKTFI